MSRTVHQHAAARAVEHDHDDIAAEVAAGNGIGLGAMARKSGRSVKTLRRWIGKGWLDAAMVGGVWQTTAAAYERAIRRMTARAKARNETPELTSPAAKSRDEQRRVEKMTRDLREAGVCP